MDLPVMPPLAPMLAKAARKLPRDGYRYDPKWDGFRAIVFRDGDELEIRSRNERPFNRYFPELLPPLRASLPDRCVVDGEIVVAGASGLDFDALQQRIHPAESRITMLARRTPAAFVAFDLIADGDTDRRSEELETRRAHLEAVLAGARPPVHLSPSTLDPDVAADWFERFEGAGLDGVIAKAQTSTYKPGERGWVKLKHSRTADCVVAGFRWHKNDGVGSLLLGLYDTDGELHHVGVAASFTARRRAELVAELAPFREDAGREHPWVDWIEFQNAGKAPTRPGMVSRWNADKDLSFEPVRPELVAEVEYDQLQGHRFRRVARFLRWRSDRDPQSCSYDQLDRVPPEELHRVFAGD